MPLPSLTVNGQDLESLGLRVETIDGPWDLPDTTDPTVVVPGRTGAARTGAQSTVAPRVISIGAIISKDPAILAKLDVLKSLFALGIVEITFANLPTRVYQTRTTGFKVKWVGAALASTSAEITVTLECSDPIAYDLNPTCVAFGTARVMVPVGTAPSNGVLVRIMAPFTNPVVTVRKPSGEIAHQFGLTRAGTAVTDYEEIDIELMKITRFQSGVASNDIGALASGDFESFAISPEDGDPNQSLGPTIECSGLSGNGGCELLHYVGHL